MKISFDDVESFKKVVLAGRLDSTNVSANEARFSAGVVASGKNTLIDLTEVEFMASLAVRMLISTARALSAKGGRLVMYGASDTVADTIEVMGFNDIVPLALSESDAIALLRE
jgi:anti-sigma B factor antagonist